MTHKVTRLASAVAFALIAMPGSAFAQVVLVTAGTPVVYAPQVSSSVICETRREQITDVYGWRVRDVGRVPFALIPSELARVEAPRRISLLAPRFQTRCALPLRLAVLTGEHRPEQRFG